MRGYRGIKYCLFIFCYVFWVLSAVFIAVGIYAKVAKEKDVVDTLTMDPALLLIVIGSVMFLITFFGCFGALRNITCLLKMFLGILTVILLLQITAGVVGYLFTDMVMERTEKLMMKAIIQYREDRDLENAIDFIQKKFQCCGVESYKDWSRNVYFDCSDTNPSLEACGVPFSCCTEVLNQTVLNTMCGYGTQKLEERPASQDIFTIGCLEKIILWCKNHLLLVAGLTSGLLLLEVCMISLAAAQVSRINQVRKQKKKNDARGRLERKDSYWYPAFANFDDE
ncbi:tetraspanin-33 isoform X1 [Synchiropus splendidus]|uniref:tetraspanin-33 isoform X1 n=1 Tax=Synchiropus splendidus TaxID=270530 RepID=UPI00237DF6D5|nr:tetraspanin-33 isoform X1 [Synchiropus splendidus]XP_053709556.1 tetraspanin-33 isoform X1 [Synchiropus splendidus]XP_053709557.1 tetraspanin-33 isoform X1 [Synchiropus splendidus]